MKIVFNNHRNKIIGLILCATIFFTFILSLSGCSPADTATNNLITQAQSFQLYRRITVINNQTDNVIFEMEGFLNYENEEDGDLSIIVEVGKNEYFRHVIHINDRTTFVVEQLDGSQFSPYSWKFRVYAAYPDISFGEDVN